MSLCSFFFNDTATTEIYTLSLHDALPIFPAPLGAVFGRRLAVPVAQLLAHGVLAPSKEIGQDRGDGGQAAAVGEEDRKSTRLNSSHANISYAVFCLKKKRIHQSLTLLRRG